MRPRTLLRPSTLLRPRTLPILALAMLAAPAAAWAQAVQPYGVAAVGHTHRYGHGYAGPLVRGTHVVRFPRPSELVPSPWSYGTYGVPTVTGIPAAPVAQPTLTVITGVSARDRRIAAEDGFPAGPRIIHVQVPRR